METLTVGAARKIANRVNLGYDCLGNCCTLANSGPKVIDYGKPTAQFDFAVEGTGGVKVGTVVVVDGIGRLVVNV